MEAKDHPSLLEASLQGFGNPPHVIINATFDEQPPRRMFYPVFYRHDSNAPRQR